MAKVIYKFYIKYKNIIYNIKYIKHCFFNNKIYFNNLINI